jgi:hypothetical protein
MIDAVEQQPCLHPEQAGDGAGGVVERRWRVRVEVQGRAGAAVGGQVGRHQRPVPVLDRVRGEVRPPVGVGRLGQVPSQDDPVLRRIFHGGDAWSLVEARLEFVELVNGLVGGASGGDVALLGH